MLITKPERDSATTVSKLLLMKIKNTSDMLLFCGYCPRNVLMLAEKIVSTGIEAAKDRRAAEMC